MKPKIRHILGLSGGKDSSALAIYMRDKVPEMEYAFCDTGKELPETYEFIDRLEAFLGKKINRLNADREFLRGVLYDCVIILFTVSYIAIQSPQISNRVYSLEE